jgi:CheY-like chemotaxis protein
MWVESEAGQGSRILFTIKARQAAAVRGSFAPLQGRRVLVVDDNATSRDVLARHVRYFGGEGTTVASAAEADARLAAGERFDLALIDQQMPVETGMEFARRIVARGKPFPVLLLQAVGEKIPEHAIAGVLHKPIRRVSFGDRVVQMLGGFTPVAKAADAMEDLRAMGCHRPLRIMMAEDNVVNQTVGRHQLARLGYQVKVVANGLEAVEAATEQEFDVILMDVQMPELDGFEATRQIRAKSSSDGLPWIIALTAGVGTADRTIARAAGMNEYLAKPLRQETLAQALVRAHDEVHARRRGTDQPKRAGMEVG